MIDGFGKYKTRDGDLIFIYGYDIGDKFYGNFCGTEIYGIWNKRGDSIKIEDSNGELVLPKCSIFDIVKKI